MNLLKIYKLTKIISLVDEPWLEKWARLLRYNQSLKFIELKLKYNKKVSLLDVGCGQDTLFYKYLTHQFPNDIKKINYVGLDPLIDKNKIKYKDLKIISDNYEDYLNSAKSEYDIITIFAVLEHVDDPYDLMKVLTKLLGKNGVLVGTTPSYFAKPVLEFLSYVLGIISKREIDEHKNYFDRKFIKNIFKEVSKLSFKGSYCHDYFELGLNNVFIVKRK